MATEVLMPKLGATMESGTIIRWYKNEGEPIQAGEPLLEILTDKINMEIEADVSGHVLKILYSPDDVVDVQLPIAFIGELGEVVPDSGTQAETVAGSSGSHETEAITAGSPLLVGEKVRATPAARKLARIEGIDLKLALGSGPNGRIHVLDVKNYLGQLSKTPRVTPLAQKIANAENVSVDTVTGTGIQGKVVKADVLNSIKPAIATAISSEGECVKLEGMRKVIAQRMVQSVTTAPHVTLTTEVDMSGSMEMRKALLPVIEKKTGLRVSYTEIIMKAVSHALVLHPKVNASLQGEYIVSNPNVNIGLAVAVPNGLVVPVIKQTEEKGLADLTAACKEFAKLARDGKLLPAHMSGGTFTISNLGMYPIDVFTPIINQPETAILGVGRIHEKPVGVQGKIELRPMMTLSLSFDHRVIDGAPAAEFLQTVKDALENPYQLIV